MPDRRHSEQQQPGDNEYLISHQLLFRLLQAI
jgi:hypothetical protein